MARTVRVRLELDRTDYKQGLRDAANDTRGFDAEVTKLGTSAGRTGGQLKDTDAAAKKLGDDVKQSGRDTRNLASDLDTTRASLRGLGDEYKRTGSVELDRYRSLTSELRKLEKAKQDLDKLVPNKSGGFLSSLTAKLPSISADAGKVFSGGFFGTLGNIASSPAGFGLLVGSAAIIGADAGAILVGGILAAIGAGGLAAGIAAQVNDPRVKGSFTALVAWAKGQLEQITSGFAPQIAAGLVALQRESQPFFASLRQPMQDLAPVVSTLLAKLGEGLAKLGPGLAKALEAAGPILERIALDLPALFQSVGTLFDTLGKHGKQAGEAIDMVFRLVGMAIGQLTAGLAVLTSAFGFLIQLADTVTGVLAKIPIVGEAFKPIHDYVDGIAHSMDGMGESAGSATGNTQGLTGALGGVAGAGTQAAAGLNSARDAAIGYQNAALALDQANLAANQSLLDLDASVKQHGTSLRDDTADGIANRQSLDAVIQGYQGQRDAAIQAAGGTNASAAAVQAADAKFHQQIQTLIDHAGALFGDKQHVQDLISSIVGIPTLHMTNVEILGLAAAQGGLASIASWLNSIPSEKRVSIISTYYTMQGTTPGGLRGPQVAQRYGGVVAYAAGGEVDYKARSGILKPSSPGTILAGEPSTGGEVLTPRFGISDERGLALADVAARWHGGHVMAGSPSQRPSSAAQGYVDNRNVTYVINDASDPQKVVAAIKEFERNNGKGWRDR